MLWKALLRYENADVTLYSQPNKAAPLMNLKAERKGIFLGSKHSLQAAFLPVVT